MKKLNPIFLSLIVLILVLVPITIFAILKNQNTRSNRVVDPYEEYMWNSFIPEKLEEQEEQSQKFAEEETLYRQLMPFDEDGQKVYAFLRKFYRDLNDKDYQSAYTVSNLGRTYDEFVQIYKDIARVRFVDSVYRENGIYEVWVAIIMNDKSMGINKILMDIKDINGTTNIVSAYSTQFTGPFDLDCTKEEDSSYESCKIVDSKTQEIMYFNDNVHMGSVALATGKADDNYRYFFDISGAAAYSNREVFAYNLQSKLLNFVGNFELFGYRDVTPGPEGEALSFDECIQDNNLDIYTSIEDYSHPCFKQYEHEYWYQQNVRTLTEGSNYFDI